MLRFVQGEMAAMFLRHEGFLGAGTYACCAWRQLEQRSRGRAGCTSAQPGLNSPVWLHPACCRWHPSGSGECRSAALCAVGAFMKVQALETLQEKAPKDKASVLCALVGTALGGWLATWHGRTGMAPPPCSWRTRALTCGLP